MAPIGVIIGMDAIICRKNFTIAKYALDRAAVCPVLSVSKKRGN